MTAQVLHPIVNSAAERNKEPILQELRNIIKVPKGDGHFPSVRILEIGSGSGQHVAYFAKGLPGNIFWQPSEYDKSCFTSICAYIVEYDLQNVAPPVYIDVRENYMSWKPEIEAPTVSKLVPITVFKENQFDYIYNSNLIHISSFDTTQNLFYNAGGLLKKGGALILYGPYGNNGVLEPESNVAFDACLKKTNSAWGVRDITNDLLPLAKESGLVLHNIINMPANNKILVWVKE